MENLFKYIPSVKNLFILAAFVAAGVFAMKDTLLEVLKIGGSDALSLVLFFLILFVLIVLGIAGYYAIARKEIEAETEKGNRDANRKIANVEDSKNAKVTMTNTPGEATIKGSEGAEVNFKDDAPSALSDDKKKAPLVPPTTQE